MAKERRNVVDTHVVVGRRLALLLHPDHRTPFASAHALLAPHDLDVVLTARAPFQGCQERLRAALPAGPPHAHLHCPANQPLQRALRGRRRPVLDVDGQGREERQGALPEAAAVRNAHGGHHARHPPLPSPHGHVDATARHEHVHLVHHSRHPAPAPLAAPPCRLATLPLLPRRRARPEAASQQPHIHVSLSVRAARGGG
mmetsp:Transcript_30572/g.97594  ORF Transcript_30572/g.97594 Transcript_30572/m.97594 type:complete len:200 (+) Transcript_30572:114-713(+)